MISSSSLRIFYVSHTFDFPSVGAPCPLPVGSVICRSKKQNKEIESCFFCYSSYFPISPHLYPSLCLQSSTRWRWCVPYATSTLTICMWAGTSPLTMAPLLVEPCLTPSSAISMQLKSLSCSFMVSIKKFVSIHAFDAEIPHGCCNSAYTHKDYTAGYLLKRWRQGIGHGVHLMINHKSDFITS